VQSAVWHEIVRQIRRGGLVGLCKCVFSTIVGFDKKTITNDCFHTAHLEVKFYCRWCRVDFSLEIGENYKSSLFLEDGHMMLFEVTYGASGEC